MFRNAFRLHARASAAKKQQLLMQQILTKQSRRLTAEVIAEIAGTTPAAAAVVPTKVAWDAATSGKQEEDPLSGVYFDLQSLRFAMAEQLESTTGSHLLPPSIEETASTETPAPMLFHQAPALMTCAALVAVPAELDVSQVWESTAVGGDEIVEPTTATHTEASPVVDFLPEEIVEQPTVNATVAAGGSDTTESDAMVAAEMQPAAEVKSASEAGEPTTSEVSAASEESVSYEFGYKF